MNFSTHVIRGNELDQSILGEIQKGSCLDALGGILADKRNAPINKRRCTLGACKRK